MIDAMAHAMVHHLGELHHRILDTDDQVEIESLWRTRRKLVQLYRKLLGKMPPNPGK